MAKSTSRKKKDDSVLFAFLAVLLSIIGFVIALIVKRNNMYVMYYAKQSLVLFIGWIIVSVIAALPFIGWFLAPILWVILIILWIVALVYSLSGQMKNIPIVSDLADKFDF